VTPTAPDLTKISLDPWDSTVFRKANLQVDVLRLDKIHHEISGNKWFKLKYYLEKARLENKKELVSFGGPYSNHLLALSAAAALYGFRSAAFIRGERPRLPSLMLNRMQKNGMQVRFLSRKDYDLIKKSSGTWDREGDDGREEKTDGGGMEQDQMFIPEGGSGFEGRKGVEEILNAVSLTVYTHIAAAAGTGCTLSGLVNASQDHQQIVGISVLKGTREIAPLEDSWMDPAKSERLKVFHEFHFGGYAKFTSLLIANMNRIFAESGIPTDFIYTAKLFSGVERLAGLGQFPEGSRVLLIHSGGLKGNHSLPSGLLQF